MARIWKSVYLVLIVAAWQVQSWSAVRAGDLYKPFRAIALPFDALHREKPNAGKDPAIEELANQIDWLEHHIDAWGAVVAKHPDVWGQSRLTRYREEYERQMAPQMTMFQVKMNAALSRSDQAFLGMALALQGAAQGGSVPQPSQTNASLTAVNAMLPSTNESSATPAPDIVISRSAPFGIGGKTPGGFSFEDPALSLEPTIQLDQMSRYLNHLSELRRINEGDDTADSPGYSLNLVRIPVSVVPGKKTRTGYGAEITVIAQPYLSRELLPTTYRNLVVKDVVDLIAPVVTQLINDPNIRPKCEDYRTKMSKATTVAVAQHTQEQIVAFNEEAQKLKDKSKGLSAQIQRLKKLVSGRSGVKMAQNPRLVALEDEKQRTDMEVVRVQNSLQEAVNRARSRAEPNDIVATDKGQEARAAIKDREDTVFRGLTVSSTKSRRARMPLAPSQIVGVLGSDQIVDIALKTYLALSSNPVNRGATHYMDVRDYLTAEVQAAYDRLTPPECDAIWQCYCGPSLANQIRTGQMDCVKITRGDLLNKLSPTGCAASDMASLPPQDPASLEDVPCPAPEKAKTAAPKTGQPSSSITPALAWAVLVESALLNEQLKQDIREAGAAKGCACNDAGDLIFYGPRPLDDARAAFNEYVKCRWPIRVFALDPVTQEQNVADAFSRRRELQVALSLAFSSGQLNAQSLLRYTRRLEWDMATIDLNRTAVAFSHGDDTFGWRFYPRFQTPPIKGNVATLWETVAGGPTRDQDLRTRQLEPGIRECTAIVVMPSFVPYVTIDTRTNWFRLTDPKCTELSMRDTMKLSRAIKTMQSSAAACSQCAHLYRDGETERLLRRVDQLDRTLPLQSMRVQIPYENALGGFEMFNHGITDLAPELIGWYGAPGIDRTSTTTLYLIGNGFSVLDNRLIAGGRLADFHLVSRQVMEVHIPPGAQVVPDLEPDPDPNKSPKQDPNRVPDQLVDVQLATPYGVTSHLLIPTAPAGAAAPGGGNKLEWKPRTTINAFFTAGENGTTPATINQIFGIAPIGCPALVIRVPRVSGMAATTRVRIRMSDDATAAVSNASPSAVEADFAYNPQTSELFLSGDALSALVRTKIIGELQSYLNYRNADGGKPGRPLSVTATGEIANPNQPPIPIQGTFSIKVTKIGR